MRSGNNLNGLPRWRIVCRRLLSRRKTLKTSEKMSSGTMRKTGRVSSWKARKDARKKLENV
jgi:hypothetical protein